MEQAISDLEKGLELEPDNETVKETMHKINSSAEEQFKAVCKKMFADAHPQDDSHSGKSIFDDQLL